MDLKKNLSYVRILLFLSISIIFTLLYLLQLPIIKKATLGIEDSKFSVRSFLKASPESHKSVVVAAIDEKSINELGRWPWSRQVMAEFISKLGSADAVALDIVFSEPSSEEEDALLADAISENDNVILGFFFRKSASAVLSEESLAYIEDAAIIRYKQYSETVGLTEFPFAEANIPSLSSVSLSAAPFNTIPDQDGLFRRYPLAFLYKGYIVPSLAVQTLRFALNNDISLELDDKGIKKGRMGAFNIDRGNYLRLNYYDHVNELSAVDIIEGRITPDFFKNKIVVIGTTEIGIYDVRPTPVDTITPGVYLHFTAISNLLNDEFLKDSKTVDLALFYFFMFLAFLISSQSSIRRRLLLYTVLAFISTSAVYMVFINLSLWLHMTLPLYGLVFYFGSVELFIFANTESQSRNLKKAFSRYVSPDLVKEIIRNPEELKLGGEQRELSVLFSDIRGFTTISEQLEPEKLVCLLNSLLDPLTECIINNGGMLDKYIGDAIMAIFNAPLDLDHHPEKAAKSAQEMILKLKELNILFEKDGLPALKVGAGVHTGAATVGNIGSKLRFDYTAIGDTVNLASRLEGLTKAYSVDIIISESTNDALGSEFLTRRLDSVRVKGKNIPLVIFELMDNTDKNTRIRDKFEEALSIYMKKGFQEAQAIFKCLAEIEGDETSYIFLNRCIYYIENPPEESWNGVHVHVDK